jgi:hypothetical protein
MGRGLEVNSHDFLPYALKGGELSVLCSGRFTMSSIERILGEPERLCENREVTDAAEN